MIETINNDLLKFNITLVSSINNLNTKPIEILITHPKLDNTDDEQEVRKTLYVVNLDDKNFKYTLNLIPNAISIGSATKKIQDKKKEELVFKKNKVNVSSFSDVKNYNEIYSSKIDDIANVYANGEEAWSYSYSLNGDFINNIGSSYATPIVSGSISLLKYYYKTKFNKNLTASDIKSLILSSSDLDQKNEKSEIISKKIYFRFEEESPRFFNFLRMMDNLESIKTFDIDESKKVYAAITKGEDNIYGIFKGLQFPLNLKNKKTKIGISFQNKKDIKIKKESNLDTKIIHKDIHRYQVLVIENKNIEVTPDNNIFVEEKNLYLAKK